MRLKETDWNAPGGAAEVEVEYPDAPIMDVVNWLRRTSAWLENHDLVERKVRRLNGILADHRNGSHQNMLTTAGGFTGEPTTVAQWVDRQMADPAVREAVYQRLKQYRDIQAKANRLAALELARAAKQAKRGAVPVS